jgi:hypothetical protein
MDQLNKNYYSIEYVDEDGEQNIKHGFMTPEQAGTLCDQFAQKGIIASIHSLTPAPPDILFANQELDEIFKKTNS